MIGVFLRGSTWIRRISNRVLVLVFLNAHAHSINKLIPCQGALLINRIVILQRLVFSSVRPYTDVFEVVNSIHPDHLGFHTYRLFRDGAIVNFVIGTYSLGGQR